MPPALLKTGPCEIVNALKDTEGAERCKDEFDQLAFPSW